MTNPRIFVAVVIAMVIIIGSMSWVTNIGIEKAMPALEEQKQKAKEIQNQQAEYIRQSLEDMGASEKIIRSALLPPSKEELSEYIIKSPSPRKPVGTWTGVKKSDKTNMAFMKFDRDNYWLMIKGTGGDYTEKGSYEFEFDRLYFTPNDGESYGLDYFMSTLKNIEFYGGGYSFTLEKTKNIKVDF